MNYRETTDYMFARLPMYHRVGAAAYKADLKPTEEFMAALGHPERRFRSIHVAGTNGKGSVSHFLASVLQEAGYKVGLYTSPHLVDFRERIRIGGEMIGEQEVVDFVQANRDTFERIGLSFFEMTVGMAFSHFAQERVDVAVVEVGMGGRLDSTNVIVPELSIITNIGFDHTQFLGDTLEKIAGEKAGIIKEGVPVVVGETQAETEAVFRATARERHAPLVFADSRYHIDKVEEYTTELTGDYQKKNIATVLAAVDELRNTGAFAVSDEQLRRGLARVVTNTHLRGRWQVVGEKPLTICETAHNEPGIRAMLGKLSAMGVERVHLVYGCVNDKDFGAILEVLGSALAAMGIAVSWYFTQPTVPRRMPVEAVLQKAQELGIDGKAYGKVEDAVAAAQAAAGDRELVLVTGSIYLVADYLATVGA